MSNRSLKIQLHAEDPKCHWCQRETTLTNIKHIKGKPDPLMATIDHVISRLDPRRWVKRQEGEVRKVLACFECNNNRSQAEVASLSKEELYIRGQGFALNPKGNPRIEKPMATVEDVVAVIEDSVDRASEYLKYSRAYADKVAADVEHHRKAAREARKFIESIS
jgi:hypothetical protein